MNKIIYDKQCTIIWHVDNLKTSHVDSAVISSVLADIDAECGNIAKMTTMRGKLHKYLGITIDYSLTGKVVFYMVNYIGKMIDDFSEDMNGESATSAAHHRFYIAKDTTQRSQTDTYFYQFLAQLLYLSKSLHTDIQFAVYFL